MNCSIKPEEWVRRAVSVADNGTELFGVRYIGSEVVGIITTTSVATAGLQFEQGATVGAAAGTTGDNPGTDGAVDTSASGTLTFQALMRKINATTDWEAWLIAALPDDAPYSAATNDMAVVADQECQGADGYVVKADTSVSDYLSAALTENGPSNAPHNHDGQVLHELLQVKAIFGTAGTATVTLTCYKCDDIAGTSTELRTWTAPATAAAQKDYPTDSGIGEPQQSTDTNRLVVKMSSPTLADHATNKLEILGRSYAHGPGVRKDKTWSAY